MRRSAYPEYVRFPYAIPNLQENARVKYFQGVSGCIGGSHFSIELRSEGRENWRYGKEFISTNAILTTDVENKLLFVYAMF